MDSSTQDRNLPASEQRLRKAREDGQVPRSRDLIHLVVLGGGLLLLSLLFPWGYERLRAAMQAQFRFTRAALDHPQHLQRVLSDTTAEGLMFFLPLGVVLLLAILLAALATGSFAYSTKSLMPELSKIGLLSGFGRLFSRQQFFEVLKLVAYTAVLAALAGLFLQAHVFDRFVRRERGGPGVGLALVKALVELHGGWAEVESEPGKGAAFILHLPYGAATTAAPPELQLDQPQAAEAAG